MDASRSARRAQMLRRHLAPEMKMASQQVSANATSSAADAAEQEKDVILYEVIDGGVCVLTLNRPTRLNSLTNEMQALYFDMLDKAAADERVRVIVVTGAGRAFCAGAEMELLKTIGSKDRQPAGMTARRSLQQSQATRIPKPIIAAINGPAAGLGFVLAMHTDVRFATKGAKFTSAFAKRGLVAEHGSSFMLPRIAGVSNALDVLLSSRVFLGDEAKDLGLVTRVYEDKDALMKATLEYAREMAKMCSPASMAAMKRQVYEHLDRDQDTSYDESDQLMTRSFKHPDSKEGVASYVEKRDPDFQGLKAGYIHDK
ncbi:3-hydroxybutyryl-CoA dehydratase-like protein, mitochondrial [Hondaea fermentalgiana]|uniref:3-hydroxybutyryl-CoA dehydratase-like protein, mitochondrial n=1 Tax=Hondaea fermentalgiana TaxID=2315210 RepID=A0A2R5GCZ6_9STRA|nr:3-hydroxybutyryl-CoA dehydratase-like protein, mitochondrial [Hondaea fermentalgiana]|eukprot:GBG28455.1 3-hydroxybutyryl-CoA dehydratase-like protein, mitochondrial [Hondaea fermentalgiana]